MKVKKAGLLTKIVVLALLVGLAVTLLDVGGQIVELEAERAELEEQVAQKEQENADLQYAIDHSDDLEQKMDILREKGMVSSGGERIFIIPK